MFKRFQDEINGNAAPRCIGIAKCTGFAKPVPTAIQQLTIVVVAALTEHGMHWCEGCLHRYGHKALRLPLR